MFCCATTVQPTRCVEWLAVSLDLFTTSPRGLDAKAKKQREAKIYALGRPLKPGEKTIDFFMCVRGGGQCMHLITKPDFQLLIVGGGLAHAAVLLHVLPSNTVPTLGTTTALPSSALFSK